VTLTGQSGRRLGHEENDEQKGWVCANRLAWVRGDVWREGTSGDGQSARGEGTQALPAKCSSKCRPLEHGRLRPRETIKSQRLAWEGLSSLRGG
jgi:hypothetical protein